MLAPLTGNHILTLARPKLHRRSRILCWFAKKTSLQNAFCRRATNNHKHITLFTCESQSNTLPSVLVMMPDTENITIHKAYPCMILTVAVAVAVAITKAVAIAAPIPRINSSTCGRIRGKWHDGFQCNWHCRTTGCANTQTQTHQH